MKSSANISLVARILCTLCLLTLTSFTNFGERPERWFNDSFRWTVQNSSSLSIKGSSNVNRFGCSTSGAFKSETILGRTLPNKTIELSGSITVDINTFDCNSRMLTSDLRKTLKANEYPQMKIHFINLERTPLTHDNLDYVGGDVFIELAGQKKRFYLRYTLSKTAESLTLSGSRAFTFSDFNLAPPQKIGGMIKVNDDFDVSFHLIIRHIS